MVSVFTSTTDKCSLSRMKSSTPRLFCFGLGYTAQVLAAGLIAKGWSVGGTCRDRPTVTALRAAGIEAYQFGPDHIPQDISRLLSGATHLLSSIPPGRDGDPVLACFERDILGLAGTLIWAGYLSTTGVYGSRDGATVREGDALAPTSDRSARRVRAEGRWLGLADAGLPIHAFRLAGIYGPGRNVLDDVRAGRARRIDKPGHMFSRIHVDDIAAVIEASMARPDPGAVYNVCDDEAAAPGDVVAYACDLLEMDVPPVQAFADLEPEMSAMQRTFWADNKRVDNTRIKDELGVKLLYPTYREGLKACLAQADT